MSDIFISHVEEDEAIARELARGLEDAGYTTWYFERDGIPVSYLEQIEEAIEQCHSILVLISLDSMSSWQVDREVERAHESGKRFIPILHGIHHAEFQTRKRAWRMAMGTTTSLPIPTEGVAPLIPRIVAGLQKLGLEPHGIGDSEQGVEKETSLPTKPLPPQTIDGQEFPKPEVSPSQEQLTLVLPSVKAQIKRRVIYIPLALTLVLLIALIVLRSHLLPGRLGVLGRGGAISETELQKLEIKNTLVGHSQAVTSLVFASDGTLLVSGAGDGVILWDTATEKISTRLVATQKGVADLAISADCKLLVTADQGDTLEVRTPIGGSTVRLWDLPSGALKRTITGLAWGVRSVGLTPKGDSVVGADVTETISAYNIASASEIKVWDTQTGELKRILTKHGELVESVAISPDGKTLASGATDKTLRLWDVETGALLWEIGVDGRLARVAFSPDGKTLVGATADGSIMTWNSETRELKRTLRGRDLYVLAIAFPPSGSLLAVSGELGTSWTSGGRGRLEFWNLETGELKRVIDMSSHITSIAFSSDGRTLATGSDDKTVRLWRATAK